MIAVDTSALMAIILDEPQAGLCIAVLEAEEEILVSAGTVAEAMIVSRRRNVGGEMISLIDGLGFEIVTITPAAARRIANTYGRWGRGVHPADLNPGDCFAYGVAKEHGCRLLPDLQTSVSPDACRSRPCAGEIETVFRSGAKGQP